MKLSAYAAQFPSAKVRLYFKNEKGTGTLVTTASNAVCPNLSGRFFPPEGVNAAQLGWPVPWWYSSEAFRWEPASASAANARA